MDVAAGQTLALEEGSYADVRDAERRQVVFGIDSCYPNPFNLATTIRYGLPEPAAVHLDVYNITGRLVRTLADGSFLETGEHSAVWDGRDQSGEQVAPGIYFYRVQAGAYGGTGRVVLLK